MTPSIPNDSQAADMALSLALHPDYRILRRLQPQLVFSEAPADRQMLKGIVLDTETTGLNTA